MAIAGSLTYDTKLDTKGFESGLNKISSTGVAIGNLMADVIKQVAQTISEVAKMGVEYYLKQVYHLLLVLHLNLHLSIIGFLLQVKLLQMELMQRLFLLVQLFYLLLQHYLLKLSKRFDKFLFERYRFKN